jgi:hypothetical protein
MPGEIQLQQSQLIYSLGFLVLLQDTPEVLKMGAESKKAA